MPEATGVAVPGDIPRQNGRQPAFDLAGIRAELRVARLHGAQEFDDRVGDGHLEPAVLRAVHDARQHQDGAHRLHAEGQRQEDREGGERAHAGQHADHVADEHADEAPQQVHREQYGVAPDGDHLESEGDLEPEPEAGEGLFDHWKPHLRTGIGIFSR